MEYICKNPVLLIMFNRPDNLYKVFAKVKEVKPRKLFLVSDGPRNENDIALVKKCREVQEKVDWECDVITDYSDVNMGCKKRVITGISNALKTEKTVIVLEDDCVPEIEFFRFMDWGLDVYKNCDDIAIISGSNLLDYKCKEKTANGFSRYINCWGWATWKTIWDKYDSFLSMFELNTSFWNIMENSGLDHSEKKYWLGIFRNAIYSRTVWDFYLQYFFFKYKWKSVYPKANLVMNIGFDENSTHMKNCPEYVLKSVPNRKKISDMFCCEFSDYREDLINEHRDKILLRDLYGFNHIKNIKLHIGNLLRFLGLR